MYSRLDIGLALIIEKLLETKIAKPDWKTRGIIEEKKENKIILRLKTLIGVLILYSLD